MSEKSSPNTRIKKKETISPANGISSSAALRKQTQTALSSNPVGHDDPDCMSPEAIKNLVHDLSVHQIELEMQNDELRRTHEELEATQDKYRDLYDFSPMGYATINDKGIITESNLTLTQMLGVDGNQVVDKPFSDFVYGNDQFWGEGSGHEAGG